MTVQFVGIAGGTGSGKSTLAIALCKANPSRYALVHLDDYYKSANNAPREGTFVNWDHPDSLDFNALFNDLCRLASGQSIEVQTKSELYHPTYTAELHNRIPHTIEPRPVVLVEGFLALHDARIRSLMDARIYLDVSIEESHMRRSGNKLMKDEAYFKEVLIPAHRQFVEPTKRYATLVIDVSHKTAEEVAHDASVHIEAVLSKK